MKLFKLELKKVAMTEDRYDDATKSFVEVPQGELDYQELVRNLLMTPGPSGAVSTDEVLQSVLIYGRIRDELKKNKPFVLLERSEYDYILQRLNGFKWRIAHPAIADFIKYVRGLKEVDVTEAAETSSPS